MATGWISEKDLVFLLQDLPPPLGRKHKLRHFERARNTTEAQEKYLYHKGKNKIIKKTEALKILQDVNVKVYDKRRKPVHFKDVFKALVRRVFEQRQIEMTQ